MLQNLSHTHEDEYMEIHEARYAHIQRELLKLNLPKGSAVLDVGCYPPFLLDFLGDHGFDVYGIASTHEQVDRKNVRVLNIETDPFPWKDRAFDCVIFTEVIEHLPHNPLVPLKEMFRVLKPGGRLIISTPNGTKLQHRVSLLAGKPVTFPLDQLLESSVNDGSLYYRHHKEYTKDELETVVLRAGFAIETSRAEIFYPPTRAKNKKDPLKQKVVKWAGYLPQLVYSPFRDSLFMIASKS